MDVSTIEQTRIAIDVMGGDNAPLASLEGIELFLKKSKRKDLHFLVYGDNEAIKEPIEKLPLLQEYSTVIHTSSVVADDEKPSIAIRQGRNSSMGMAIRAVRSGEANAAVSSGNTGALMAMSKIILRTLPGIERPAIGGYMPNQKDGCVMLDLGANVTSDANNLFEFAVMGHAFAKIILGIEDPSIGLLNIGSEEMKGNEAVKTAADMLKASDLPLNFYGFIEGNDINLGTVDVVVTDGFTGNIALKTVEGTAKMFRHFFTQGFNSGPLAKLGGLLSRKALKKATEHMDPRHHNGAMFLGLNGIIIKSHGGSDALGCSNAIEVAINLSEKRINEQIMHEMVTSGHIPEDEDLTNLVLEEGN